jgi:hypothetical protein
MGELRCPGEQTGAEPGEEKEHGLARREASDEAVLHEQCDGERDADQVVVMQVGAGERGEDEEGNGGLGARGSGDGGHRNRGLDEEGGVDAEWAGKGKNINQPASEFRRFAGEEDVAHGRAGDVDKAGPGGGAKGEECGDGQCDGGEGGIGKGDGGAAEQEKRQHKAELGFDGGETDQDSGKTRPAGEEQKATADEGGEEGGVLMFQEVFQAGRAGSDGGDQPPALAGEPEQTGQEDKGAGIERQHRVPRGEPVEPGGEEQVVGRVAPEMIG